MLPLIIFLSFVLSVSADESCHAECFEDKMPQCGVWLVSESSAGVGGTYQLNEGVVNMSCTFSSLPIPATVSWAYRTPNGANWNEFACSNKDENKQCSKDTEHTVSSRCILRASALTQSGSYRCQARLNEGGSKAISSETIINVVGISKVEVVKKEMKYGQTGFVEVEVCANPKPEVFWQVGGAIIRPHEGAGRVAATHIHPLKHRSVAEGPAQPVTYCYSGRLIISKVERSESISVIVRNEGETRTVPLNLSVSGVPKNGSVMYKSFLALVVVLISVFYRFE